MGTAVGVGSGVGTTGAVVGTGTGEATTVGTGVELGAGTGVDSSAIQPVPTVASGTCKTETTRCGSAVA